MKPKDLQSTEHNQVIVEQFTKQATPFLEMPEHSEQAAMNLLIEQLQLTGNESVLDVACGPGIVACAVAPNASSVTGVDITPAMIQQAKKLQQEKNLINVSWQIGDAMQLPFAEGSFARVVTRYTLHHFLNPVAVVHEMFRVCEPGGRIVVVDVVTSKEQARADQYNMMEKLRDPSHARALRQSELHEIMLATGLQSVQTSFYRLHVMLETILAASFPDANDADKLRQLFNDELNSNLAGFDPYQDESGQIRFSFPISIIAGMKPPA